MLDIDYINGLKTDEVFGRSRYQTEIHKRLETVNLNRIEYSHIFQLRGIDQITRFTTYPLKVKRHIHDENVKHITDQELGYLLNLLDMQKVIITCHDLIPWTYSGNRSYRWKCIMKGLQKADHIITVSNYSKEEIRKNLEYPSEKIHVIYNAVDNNTYSPAGEIPDLKAYNIEDDTKIILYVGSEQPRKNIPLLIKAFSILKKRIPNAKLIKIGRHQALKERQKNLKLINDLHLGGDIILIDYVDESDIPKYYRAADVFVFPSLYEGFGLPPLEAMACGCPVISSNTTSLPEVVGDAGILLPPNDLNSLVSAMEEVLINDSLREDLSKKGLENSKRFSWERSAKETFKIYLEADQD